MRLLTVAVVSAVVVPSSALAIPSTVGEGAGPVTVTVNPDLRPQLATVPGLTPRTTRPVAALVDGEGMQTDFVANELVLATSDPAQLRAFVDRWRGRVARSVEVRGAPTLHLVQVDPASADPSQLSDHLALLNPGQPKAENLFVSDAGGLGLLAIAAEAAVEKYPVAVNWVNEYFDYEGQSTFEAGTGPTGFSNDPTSGYVRDAYRWSFLSSGSVQDIGVTSAWSLMDSVDRLDNQVRIGIVDAGFKPDVGSDLPQWTAMSPLPWAGPLDPGPSSRPWHGNDSASAAAAVPDNFVGSAGPAGPIATLSLVYTTPDYFLSMNSVATALFNGSKVINMSFGARVPWPLAWTVLPFDGFTWAVRAFNNVLLFTAAGNGNENVDATTGIGPFSWEKAWHTPCENAGVRCVGGLALNSLNRDPQSKYGHEDVDIFAPFQVLVGADPAHPVVGAAHVAAGTSVSSPYAAGVAALIWASNPNLGADMVDTILLRNLRESPDERVKRKVIQAFDAVRDAMPAVVSIQTPLDGQILSAVTPTLFSASIYDDGHGVPSVAWSRNGIPFGTSSQVVALLPPGVHSVRARATFPDGAIASDTITVNVVNHTPTVHISAPRNPDNSPVAFTQSELIPFHATSLDDAGPLPAPQLTWHLDGATASFATGHNPTVNTGAGLGLHTITLRGCDTFSVCATDTVPILIQPNGTNQPPTVHITNPANGATLWVNGSDASGIYHELTVTGVAVDPEGGPVSLVWLDNDVQVATGASATLRLHGECEHYGHRLTLRATDNAGNVREDEVDVTVAIIC